MPKRSKKASPQWYQIPRIWAGWVAGIGAAAVAITVIAGYIDLPSRVNEVEASDAEQSKILDRIVAVWEHQQQVPEQQMQQQYYQARVSYYEEYDERTDTYWCCEDYNGRECQERWYEC